ncbi:thiolase domain-containing protein [Variovorax sp. M-6]|uniref:thiolase domain-containing protein n=1 Tax=Variovorax sp. M-6 TaxID=3233041 RepID=UPI003F9DBA28
MLRACIAGIYEHPTRKAPDKTVAQLHAECAKGALEDAGLTLRDVDGYFCARDAPGLGANSMADYLGLTRLTHIDTTDTGGSAYLIHVAHAAQAIMSGRCKVALITMAGRPRSEGSAGADVGARLLTPTVPEVPWEVPYGPNTLNLYAMVAARHMYEFGTTSEQLAWVKVAASHHAQHNPHAMLRDPVTVADVLASPRVSDPLGKLDCCVVSDGGGAVVLAHPSIAGSLKHPRIQVIGSGESIQGQRGGAIDLMRSGAAISGPIAFEEARVTPRDIRYASLYDSFTITVIVQLEDLGFCEKGRGGWFVADGNLISGIGSLPFNTDGGGLCNNHPGHRGGMTKVIEAVRQLRGQAHPAVQVRDCDLALVQGTGGMLGSRHGSATIILERV